MSDAGIKLDPLKFTAEIQSADGSVHLSQAAVPYGIHAKRSLIRQRWTMLVVIGAVFVLLNAAVFYLIWHTVASDLAFVNAHPELADKRIITSGVIMALIGATVAQTGAVTWAMARFLFPTQLAEDSDDEWHYSATAGYALTLYSRRSSSYLIGTTESPAFKLRCINTVSTHRPSLNPTDLKVPTGANPKLECKLILQRDRLRSSGPYAAAILAALNTARRVLQPFANGAGTRFLAYAT